MSESTKMENLWNGFVGFQIIPATIFFAFNHNNFGFALLVIAAILWIVGVNVKHKPQNKRKYKISFSVIAILELSLTVFILFVFSERGNPKPPEQSKDSIAIKTPIKYSRPKYDKKVDTEQYSKDTLLISMSKQLIRELHEYINSRVINEPLIDWGKWDKSQMSEQEFWNKSVNEMTRYGNETMNTYESRFRGRAMYLRDEFFKRNIRGNPRFDSKIELPINYFGLNDVASLFDKMILDLETSIKNRAK